MRMTKIERRRSRCCHQGQRYHTWPCHRRPRSLRGRWLLLHVCRLCCEAWRGEVKTNQEVSFVILWSHQMSFPVADSLIGPHPTSTERRLYIDEEKPRSHIETNVDLLERSQVHCHQRLPPIRSRVFQQRLGRGKRPWSWLSIGI